jgi:hypothetical protein
MPTYERCLQPEHEDLFLLPAETTVNESHIQDLDIFDNLRTTVTALDPAERYPKIVVEV